MSKTKRLLSVTLASVMLFASAFSAFAEDTETVVEPLRGTVAAGNVTVKPDVTEVTVPVTITFDNKQTSPHGQFDISATGATATLKSAAFKTSDNSNFTPDETVPDGAGLVDKSIYVDADGVNTENGRVVVESDVSEGMQPSVSYVTVDVVLKFDTALTAGQVIDVVISNIAATNLSEAPWTGMKAVNGTITVKAAEPVITMSVGAKSDFQIGATVNYTYDGELTHKGVLVYAGNYDESTVGISTAKAYQDFSSLTTNNYIYFQGFSLDNAVNVDYTIIPYVRNNDVYYYGDPVTYNYAKDFCVERLNSSNATTKERVIAILNTYYAITGTPAYEGQPAVTLPEVDTSLLYTCTVPETYVERDFESNTVVTGNTQINFMLMPEFSNYTGTVASKGIVVMKPSVYTEGAKVEVDGVNISSPWSSGYLKLTGMNIQNIGKNYAFATYVVDENSNYYYGTQIMSSYAKYLVDKLNNATNKLETAQKAMMILNLYKTVYGSDLYTTTTAQ